MRVCVREWGAYAAQHKRPVFERIGCMSAGGHFRCPFKTRKQATPGENRMFGFKMVSSGGKNESIFEPFKIKHPEIEHNSIYIYIEIDR